MLCVLYPNCSLWLCGVWVGSGETHIYVLQYMYNALNTSNNLHRSVKTSKLLIFLSIKLYRRPFTRSWLSWNNSDFWRYGGGGGFLNFALSFNNNFKPNDGTFLFHLSCIYCRQRLTFTLCRKAGTHNLGKDAVLTIGLTKSEMFTLLFHAGSMTIDV